MVNDDYIMMVINGESRLLTVYDGYEWVMTVINISW